MLRGAGGCWWKILKSPKGLAPRPASQNQNQVLVVGLISHRCNSGVSTHAPLSMCHFFCVWCTACRIFVPQPGIKPGPWQWKCQVLTTGPLENSLCVSLLIAVVGRPYLNNCQPLILFFCFPASVRAGHSILWWGMPRSSWMSTKRGRLPKKLWRYRRVWGLFPEPQKDLAPSWDSRSGFRPTVWA